MPQAKPWVEHELTLATRVHLLQISENVKAAAMKLRENFHLLGNAEQYEHAEVNITEQLFSKL